MPDTPTPTPTHELEVEVCKVLQVDVALLKERFPTEWAEVLEDCETEEEAERELVVDAYTEGGAEDLFYATPHDTDDYVVTRL